MVSQDNLTMEQVQEKMTCLREVFPVVRLLDGAALEQMEIGKKSDADMSSSCECYTFWQKESPCENCISMKTLKTKQQYSKIEFVGTIMFQVFSKYVQIDGKDYVMEMVKALDEDTILDAEGRKKLSYKLEGDNDKLYRDALTNVYNRRYYEEEVKSWNRPAGVAVIDVDDFKVWNDSYGHRAGDSALLTIANVIRNNVRKSDIVLRFGGDEFLLIVPGVSEEIFSKKLNQIRKKIVESKLPGFPRLTLSVSIGGVLSMGEDMESAVARADRMMYLAKTTKNKVVTVWDNMNSSEQSGETDEAQKEVREQILIVDDSAMNRAILSDILEKDYRILEASSGEECLEVLRQNGFGISLILLDIVMPEMNGFEVLAFMNRNHWIEDIPVIMISSEDSERYIRRAYDLGVSDYINRPFDAQIVYRRVNNIIRLYAKQRRLIRLVKDQIYEKEKNNQMMVSILSQIVEFRNGESGLHVLHINLITEILMEKLSQKTDRYPLSWSEQYLIATASALHDIGKIGINEAILNKPGKLTKEEFEIMKTHTLIGESILEGLDYYKNERLIKIAIQICRWHHERYDGKGYPDGLRGDEIPISAQVVSIADAYDALISERVYKPAYSHEKAVQMIANGECGGFNPILLECLVESQDRIREELLKQNVYADRYDEYSDKIIKNDNMSENSGGGNEFQSVDTLMNRYIKTI